MPGERKVYLNGDFVPEAEARISIFDSALMFGDMVFEMTRTFRGEPFRLRDHLERLFASMRVLEIDCDMTLAQMEGATLDTLAANRDAIPQGIDVQIMHNVSRGPLPLYRSVFPDGLRPTITISCWPLIWHLAPYARLYATGVHAVITPQRSVPSRLIDPKIKNRSRVYYQMANLEAARIDPEARALLTDEDGTITEGSGGNFFLVKDGALYTPEPRNILRGVTRRALMELAADLGIRCTERNVEPYDVMTADEAFFTATSFSILPVTRFNGQPLGKGTPGPVTERLMAGWSDMVGFDIVQQARSYAQMAEKPAGSTQCQ